MGGGARGRRDAAELFAGERLSGFGGDLELGADGKQQRTLSSPKASWTVDTMRARSSGSAFADEELVSSKRRRTSVARCPASDRAYPSGPHPGDEQHHDHVDHRATSSRPSTARVPYGGMKTRS